jgi:antitoxin component of RelBE/YafQ-DinJ toxin-antitoxin module
MNQQRVIMQVPLPKTLKIASEAITKELGFSSLQEAIRVFLTKLSRREITIAMEESDERLSPRAARRYAKMISEIREGKVKTTSFTDVDEMLHYLRT